MSFIFPTSPVIAGTAWAPADNLPSTTDAASAASSVRMTTGAESAIADRLAASVEARTDVTATGAAPDADEQVRTDTSAGSGTPAATVITASATVDVFDAAWMQQPVIYLAVAALCLVVVLRFLKRAVAPLGALIQAAAAATVVALAATTALAMLVVAALMTAR
ncbi:hypothetical protein [Actinoplanes sp. DH11]|uniref:hypothetical protein n=1 Tax=Actinoplanes sp. DH11 TaxID=2857011 RepID=UPI001E28E6CD|nr:hypothetical protein [Actinoplanes sp. DH11]